MGQLCKMDLFQAYIILLILSVNVVMIRQKRNSFTRNSQKMTKTQTSDTNIQNSKPQDEKFQPFQARKGSLNEPRTGLSELLANMNTRESIVLKALGGDNNFHPRKPPKHKENIFSKISQLIKFQDIPMPICHSNRTNPLRCLRQRPYTSICQNNKIVLIDRSQLNKFSVVLDLSKNQQPVPPERSSTSRALMNYSKVFRNNSNDGFRVKKNISFMNKFVHLSAQKVVFQQKCKRQKSLEKTTVLRKATPSKKAQQRYKQQQQQDFQIGGWEYFE